MILNQLANHQLNTMKRIIYILVVGLLLVFCSYSFISGDDDVSRDINQAICLGQSDHIAGYFAPEVVLGVQGEDHNCPKEQAELALKEFFRRNTPSQFLCTTGSCYISGKLVTSAGKSYKLDYTLKTVDNKTFITNIHIY